MANDIEHLFMNGLSGFKVLSPLDCTFNFISPHFFEAGFYYVFLAGLELVM